MDKAEIEERIAEIERAKGDGERAHGLADSLYLDVLQAIAEGAEDAAKLARSALKAEKIEFAKYYA